jgi:hypothetical protein
MKILFILLILLVLCYYYSNITYSNITYSNIQFLNKYELYKLLETNTEYYDTFNKYDYSVRSIDSIANYINIIKNSVSDFTDSEKNILMRAINMANIRLRKINLPYFDGNVAADIVWKMGITKDTNYENGYPHTIKDTILLSRNYNVNMNSLVDILVHEKVHIYQKKYYDKYLLYLKEKKFNIIRKKLDSDNIRANPDTYYDNNIYKKNNQIYMMQYNINPNSISDVMPSDQYYEHPLETMAIEISKL